MRTQRPSTPGRRGLRAALVAGAALGVVVALAGLGGAQAAFSATTANPGDAFATAQLQPPSGLSVTQSCTSPPTITHRPYSAATGTGGVTSISIAPPTGTSAGDVLIAQIAYRDGAETITTPSGWTQVTTGSSGTQITSTIYWKVAGAGETAAVFSRPAGSPGDMGGSIIAYVGASTSTPVAVGATGVGTTATAPSVTTAAPTTEVTRFLTKRQDALPAPALTTQIYSSTTTGGPAGLGGTAADETFAGPGTIPSRSSTSSTSLSSEWVAQTVVLQRPPGTPTANLSWTASPSTWGTGYLLDRQVAGSTQASQTLAGVATTSATDGPLVTGTTYTYRLTTYRSSWRSSSVTATLTPNC